MATSLISRIVAELDAPLCAVDRTGRIREANAAFAVLAGTTVDGLRGTSLLALLPASDAALVSERLARGPSAVSEEPLVSTLGTGPGPGCAVHLRVLPADGPLEEALIAATAIADAGVLNQPKSVREMEAIMRNAPVGIIFTRDRRVVGYNRKFAEMFGFEGDSALNAPGRSLYRSDDEYDALGRAAAPLLSQGKPYQAEVPMRRQDGADIWVNLIGYVQNLANTSEGTIWILEDITEKKRLEEALRQTLREMEAIMDNAPVAVLFTRARRIVRANSRLAEIFGYGRDELIGKPARLLLRSDDEYAAVDREATPLLARSKPFQTEMFLRRKQGDDVWVNLFAYVQNRENPAEGTIWIAEDRSFVKRTEEALKRAYIEQRVILDHSVVGIAFIRNRTFQRCNRRLEELYGYGPGELEGHSTRLLFRSDDTHERMGAVVYEALTSGETFAAEAVHYRRSGEPFWVRVTGRSIEPGNPDSGSIWNFEDITARKMAEEALKRSRDELEMHVEERTRQLSEANANLQKEIEERQRVAEALRRSEVLLRKANEDLERHVEQRTAQLRSTIEDLEAFSYTISHDLRAPLRAISGYAEVLGEEIPADANDEVRGLLARISANGARMSQLIDGLLEFSRSGRREFALQSVDMQQLVNSVLTERRATSGNGEARVQVTIGTLPHALGDPVLLRQVWENLLSNAFKYSSAEPQPSVRIEGYLQDGEAVYMVRDNGVGFDMQYAGKLFGVFERMNTGAKFEGVGVGLAIVRRIVQRHGGTVWAESEPGEGASFYFALAAAP